MDNIKDKQSGFNVESILLTESSFTRKGKINFSESEQEVSFETGVGSKDNTVNVKLTTTVTNKLKDEEQYNNSSLKFEIMANQLYVASQRVL